MVLLADGRLRNFLVRVHVRCLIARSHRERARVRLWRAKLSDAPLIQTTHILTMVNYGGGALLVYHLLRMYTLTARLRRGLRARAGHRVVFFARGVRGR